MGHGSSALRKNPSRRARTKSDLPESSWLLLGPVLEGRALVFSPSFGKEEIQVAWVTGSSRGLGRAIATELCHLGAKVAQNSPGVGLTYPHPHHSNESFAQFDGLPHGTSKRAELRDHLGPNGALASIRRTFHVPTGPHFVLPRMARMVSVYAPCHWSWNEEATTWYVPSMGAVQVSRDSKTFRAGS
jgi:hypothetical protein